MESSHQKAAAVSGESIARILREGNKETFAAAKDAIMERVLLATVQEAIEELGHPEAIAEQALRHIDPQDSVLHQAVAHVKTHLLDAVAQRATDELSEPEAIVRQAQDRVEDRHKALAGAKDLLKSRLIEAVAQRSITELADAEAVARQARTHVADDAEPLTQGQALLTKNLVTEIARRSTNELANPKATAREARAHIDNAHTVVIGAVDELKQRLIAEIAEQATDTLNDPAVTARRAHALIDPQHTLILEAVDTLKEQLLETIVQESLAKISGAIQNGEAAPSTEAASPERKAYVKTSVVEARSTSSPAPANAAPAPSTSPQMRRRKAANGYDTDGEPLPALPEAAPDAEADAEAALADYYVYGIVAHQGLALADALAEAAIDPPYTPFLMPHQGITAIVSELPALAEEAAEAPHWHDAVKAIQDRILEQFNAAGFTVLPMYGTTRHPSQADLEQTLARHAEALEAALHTLAGKQEWNVKLYCDAAKVEREVQRRDDTIEAFLKHFAESAELWSEAGAEAELEAVRQGLEAPLSEIIEAILSNCQYHSHRMLEALALASRAVPTSEDSVFGNSRMVLNASYLLVETQGEAFRAVLEHLAAEYDTLGLVYYIGGPHPPCWFALADMPVL